jgi:Protein of unknown function (DUF4038)/Domain of unknown function (DUF5060)
MQRILFVLVMATCVTANICAAENPSQSDANVMVELSFTAKHAHEDPFNKVSLDVEFTDSQGRTLRVPAFWAGGNDWKVRYASSKIGDYRFRTHCSDTRDPGLHGVMGTVHIKPYTGTNPFYKHGPLEVAADRRYFQHADGTPFFWLGDTWWMGLCQRLHWPDEVKKLTADRKRKGFNVVQIVAGLYPDMPPFDPRGANEAGFPWEEKYDRIRPEYFDAADRRIEYLVDQGFSPCIVGAWGYFIPLMGVEKAKQHWRYLIARYGALPVVWCAAGEANLPWYLAKGFPYDDRKQVKDWTEVMRYIRATDPYHRPLTIHPTGIGRLSARNATDDPALLDFDMLQTPHAQREAVGPTVQTVQQSYADKPTMPVINGEAAYEMLSDRLPTQWTRQMFWLCLTNGAAGHTYGANGIWQCNRRGEPHGKSPHGGDYGHIPWDEAMNLAGSQQMGLGKKLFEKFEWQKFTPHPEWAEYAELDGTLKPKWAHWIWTPEGDPTIDAPVAKRYFRKTFELPAGDAPPRGILWISADDRLTAYLNGKRVAAHAGTGTFVSVDVSSTLKPGRNVLAVEAENLKAPVAANPAGLLANFQLQTASGKSLVIDTDTSWRCAKEVTKGSDWTSLDFKDSAWMPAKDLGPYGRKPWGTFAKSTAYGPYSTGFPDKVRIIYVPESLPVRLKHIQADAKYRTQAFDPTNGQSTDLGAVQPDANSGGGVKKPPSIQSDDWVIVIERIE